MSKTFDHYVDAIPGQKYVVGYDGRGWPQLATPNDPLYAFQLLPYIDRLERRIGNLESMVGNLLARLEKAAECE